jgi:hypothetical protein
VQEVGGVQGMKASLPIVVVTVPHEEDEELGVRGEGWQNRYNHYKFRLVAAKQSLFFNIFLEMSKRKLESIVSNFIVQQTLVSSQYQYNLIHPLPIKFDYLLRKLGFSDFDLFADSYMDANLNPKIRF